MTALPPITVLMCAYNAENFIEDAIVSVLNQTFSDFIFLIINDGSNDQTEQVIRSFSDNRIRLVNQPNQGIATSLNNGLQLISTEFIARFDADDICYPQRLERQLDILNENPSISIAGSAADYVDESGEFVFTYCPPCKTSEEIAGSKMEVCPFIHSSVMYRKSVLGPDLYNPDAFSFEDHLLWVQILDRARGVNIKEPLIKVRLNPQSLTIDDKWRPRRFREIRKNSLQTGHISKLESKELKEIARMQNNSALKEAAYHSLLAKKYLWNNFQPAIARKHIRKLITANHFNLLPYLMYGASCLPGPAVKKIYQLFKEVRS